MASRGRVTQYGAEVFYQTGSSARVTQYGAEVFIVGSPYTASTPTYTLGAYGDACDTVTPDAAWTLRNVTITGTGSVYPIPVDATGDCIHRAFTDPAADFSLVAHIKNLTSLGNMTGLFAVDSSGNGVGYSPYDDGNGYTWTLASYAYSATRNGSAVGGIVIADHWVELRRVGTGWQGRWSNGNGVWSTWTAAYTDARTITRVGFGAMNYKGAQTPQLDLFVYGTTKAVVDVSGMVGAGVSQYGAEVFYQPTSNARVGQYGAEVFFQDTSTEPVVVSGASRVFGS